MPTSVNKRTNFLRILPALGVSPAAKLLPTRSACPLCRRDSSLAIYPDRLFGGEWAACRHCGFYGDMIELTARAWKLKLADAVRRLYADKQLELGVTEHIDGVAATAVAEISVQRRLDQFWQNAQKHYVAADSPSLRELQHKIQPWQRAADWEQRGGQFIGSASLDDVARMLRPRTPEADNKKRRQKPSIFVGDGWQDVLVVPFWDLPGRLSGFAFIGREAKYPDDVVLCPVPGRPSVEGRHVFGVGMRDAGAKNTAQSGLPVVAIADPVLAIQLHLRHFQEHVKPLPLIVSCWTDAVGPGDVWQTIPHADIVFWNAGDPLAAVAQARRCNGRVSNYRMPFREQLSNRPASDWLRLIANAAAPWRDVLRKHLSRVPADEVEGDVLRLGLPPQEREEVAEGCDPGVRDRITASTVHDHVVRFAGHRIVEQHDSWYTQSGDCIANAAFRLTDVFVRGGESWYQGTIRFGGNAYDFLEPCPLLDSGLFKWAMPFLRDRMAAGILQYNPTWDKHGTRIAAALSAPAITRMPARVGWNPANGNFDFPSFSLTSTGLVRPVVKLPTLVGAPADFHFSGDLSAATIRALSGNHDETRLFWAVTTTLLRGLLSTDAAGCLLTGDGAAAVGREVLSLLGCPHRTWHNLHHYQHDWPVLLTNVVGEDITWLRDAGQRLLYLPVPMATAWVLGTRNQWTTIVLHRKLCELQLLPRDIVSVLPAYLQDLLLRRRSFDDNNLVTDLCHWFERLGGDPNMVAAGQQLVLPPTDAHVSYCTRRLMAAAIKAGLIDIGRDGFEDVPMSVTTLPSGELVIDQNRFGDVVMALTKIRPDVLQITKALQQTGDLTAETQQGDSHYWRFSREWSHLLAQEQPWPTKKIKLRLSAL